MGLGPFDWSGGTFLAVYLALFAAALAISFVLPRWLRPAGRRNFAALNADELAFLAGGPIRLAEANVSRLLTSKAMAIAPSKQFDIARPGGGETPAERALLAMTSPATWLSVNIALQSAADGTRQKLIDLGLCNRDSAMRWLRRWQAAPFVALFVFGAIKWGIGLARGRPIGFLTVLLIATLIAAAIRIRAVDHRTRAGDAALNEARRYASRLQFAPLTNETGLAVALFGTAVLAGSALTAFHVQRAGASNSGGGDSGSSSGGDSGGGCGGGGCGGCGS